MFAKIAKQSLFGHRPISRGLKAFVESEKFVVVQETRGKVLRFPGVWLRDNCQCKECFHCSSKSRKLDWEKFDTNVGVASVSADPESENVGIKWTDGHSATFHLNWLRQRDFSADNRDKYLKSSYRPSPIHWSKKDFEKSLEIFDYDDVTKNDKTLQKWLEALAVKGIALLRNAPLDRGVIKHLASRVGYIKRTTYGEVFTVEVKSNAQNVAFLSEPLPIHTDLPYYEYKPSVTILHSFMQSKSKGGGNLLCDGFHLADRLKSEYPEYYKRLNETEVDWNDIGDEAENGYAYHNLWRTPVICTDKTGTYSRINHNIHQRDSHFNVPLDEVIPWYEAYAKFVQMAYEEAFEYKTSSGDVLAFNNIRLLHGRTGYEDTDDNTRCIVGCFMDWDTLYSKLRVLKSRHFGDA